MVNQKFAARLQVGPNCLLLFIDETGHETFADKNYWVGARLTAHRRLPSSQSHWRRPDCCLGYWLTLGDGEDRSSRVARRSI
jgi:hypothetical protein